MKPKNEKNAKLNPLAWLGMLVFLGLPMLVLTLKSTRSFKTGGYLLHENYYFASVAPGMVIILFFLFVTIATYWLRERISKNPNKKYKDKLKKMNFIALNV